MYIKRSFFGTRNRPLSSLKLRGWALYSDRVIRRRRCCVRRATTTTTPSSASTSGRSPETRSQTELQFRHGVHFTFCFAQVGPVRGSGCVGQSSAPTGRRWLIPISIYGLQRVRPSENLRGPEPPAIDKRSYSVGPQSEVCLHRSKHSENSSR